MAYLILNDFKKIIQSDNLNQIIGGDLTILDQVKQAAQTEVTSYLIQKYLCAREFADVNQWSPTTIYKGLNRVYLDATAYDAAGTYAIDNLTLQAGNVYICTTAITVPEAFTIGHWSLIGPQHRMYFVTLPYNEFQFEDIYAKSNQVWWNNKTYTCIMGTVLLSHATQLQYGEYNQLPPRNVAPDDAVNGVQFWGTGTPYSVAAGTRPTNTAKWTEADSRNPQLVNYCIDVALYHVHSRIAPRNIPELRVKRYDDVIKWLENAAQGKFITAALPLIQPKQGERIRWGSDIKRQNNY